MSGGARDIARSVRALNGDATFWTTMFAASCLGTNLGDFWVDELGLGRALSFVSLIVVCAFAILADRRFGGGAESFYWTAIVALRAAATNAADFLTHDLHLSYAGSAAVLAVIALAVGLRTRFLPGAGRSPLVDGWYWAAMFVAGLFGTVAGDLASHTVGLFAAAAALTTLLVSVLLLRGRLASRALAYWVAVLAERSAGTPVGDALASRHALGLGLPLAMACTGICFAVALIIRRRSG